MTLLSDLFLLSSVVIYWIIGGVGLLMMGATLGVVLSFGSNGEWLMKLQRARPRMRHRR